MDISSFYNKTLIEISDSDILAIPSIIGYPNLTRIELQNCYTISTIVSCPSLSYIEIGDIVQYATSFSTLSNLEVLKMPKLHVAPLYFCSGLTKLKEVDLRNCQVLLPSAFANCTNLSSLNIDNCKFIYPNAISNCPSLLHLNLSVCAGFYIYTAGLTNISAPVASTVYCTSLSNCSEIYAPNATSVYLNDTVLSNFDFPNAITFTAYNVKTSVVPTFNLPKAVSFTYVHNTNYYLSQVTLSNVKTLAFGASGNSFNFPDCMYFIPSSTLDCSYLSLPNCLWFSLSSYYRLRVPEINLPKCKYFSFSGSTAYQNNIIKKIYLPECVNFVAYNLSSARGLSEIVLGKCTWLAANTFAFCSALEKLVILTPDVVCHIAGNVGFTTTPMSASSYLGYYGSIYVPSSLVDRYKTAINWSLYADRITAYVDPSATVVRLENGYGVIPTRALPPDPTYEFYMVDNEASVYARVANPTSGQWSTFNPQVGNSYYCMHTWGEIKSIYYWGTYAGSQYTSYLLSQVQVGDSFLVYTPTNESYWTFGSQDGSIFIELYHDSIMPPSAVEK